MHDFNNTPCNQPLGWALFNEITLVISLFSFSSHRRIAHSMSHARHFRVSLRKTVKIIKRGKSIKTFGNTTLRSSDAADNFQPFCRTLRKKKTNWMPKVTFYSLMFFYLFLSLLASLCNSKVPALFHFKFFCSQDFLLHRIIESSAGWAQTLIESRRVGAEPPAMAPVRWCWREMCPPAAILRWTLSLWQGKCFLTSILSCLNKKGITPHTQVYAEIICCGFSHTFSPWKVLFFFFCKVNWWYLHHYEAFLALHLLIDGCENAAYFIFFS